MSVSDKDKVLAKIKNFLPGGNCITLMTLIRRRMLVFYVCEHEEKKREKFLMRKKFLRQEENLCREEKFNKSIRKKPKARKRAFKVSKIPSISNSTLFIYLFFTVNRLNFNFNETVRI